MSKINLIYGNGDVFNTHLNINPFKQENDPESVVRGDIKNLDNYADDSELEELLAIDVLDYIPLNETSEVISNWVKKIRYGGKIVIGGIDLMDVCKDFSQYKIGLDEANLLIHGEQDKPYLIRRVGFTAISVAGYLESKGLKVNKKRTSNYKMIVEAVR